MIDAGRPLARDEFDELRELLNSAPGAMSLPEAEGFMTAIISAPVFKVTSEWLPLVHGEREHKSLDEARRLFGHLMRLYNGICNGISDLRSCSSTDFNDRDETREWSAGYLRAARLDDEWRHDEFGAAALLPMGVLAGEFDLVGQEGADGKIIEDATEHERKYRQELPDLARELHEYWVEVRGLVEEDEVPIKVGRNDPCPCGSGKK